MSRIRLSGVVAVVFLITVSCPVFGQVNTWSNFNKGIALFCKGELNQAYPYFKSACKNGNKTGCLYAGMVKEMQGGNGLQLAGKYYSEACRRGLSIACVYLKGVIFKRKYLPKWRFDGKGLDTY